ncbi:MAG: cobalt-precorrin-5B (C(1))-methyltransferase [Coprobacter sp.]|nr:cobalt-precorrin-5B (C(1))-methyltransferase [Coprobacter sp.]
MILIFGGTTEGRAAVKVVAESGKAYLYSTLTSGQQLETPAGEHISGRMTAESMRQLCLEREIRLIVDAAHPFAVGLHGTVAEVAGELHLPVIRYERRPVAGDMPGVIWCGSYEEAVKRLETDGVERLLILTGVRTLPRLKPFWEKHACRFRILDREESLKDALACGVPREDILYYHPDESELDVWRRESPQAVITKESGESGRFPEKVAAAQELGIPLYVVRRPALPAAFHTVYTESGLRRRIEDFLPDFFSLKSGYTTGTCACAAACAALYTLLTGHPADTITVALPAGERVTLPVENITVGSRSVRAAVIKRSGDDPDVTNGCEITVEVALNGSGEIRFLQGEGVGQVTLPGLGIPVGEPAVNPAPRRMIRDNFEAMGVRGADVTVSVRDGERLAQKTFNSRLGIVGGISIIGTSGIVRPFSNEAFVASIEQSVKVAAATGCTRLVLNSGARSEAVLRQCFAGLPPQSFIQYGNFIGATLAIAARYPFEQVVLGIMTGKAVKLAEGHLDTHSRLQTVNRDFLVRVADEAGCSPAVAGIIRQMTLARELQTALEPADRDKFFRELLVRCMQHCKPLFPAGKLTVLLISEDGNILYDNYY